ncbi:copper amine oxidase N-terminal domain-containing protein, partial [Paenibacillus apiarius]|uniref:copper amine oxidase N-terminal domain-containing protein n=1 Tax=Paenibacillus apiarius TaxID=46240 RepID=UPI003B3BAD3A
PDPRHFQYLRGTAKTLEELGAKWAPSSTYGQRLVEELGKLKGVKSEAPAAKPTGDAADIEVNGKKIAEGPLINGYVFAPVRAVGGALGAKIGWDGKNAKVNGKPVPDCQLIGGSAYAPVRAVAEAAGATVKWNGKERKVSVSKK